MIPTRPGAAPDDLNGLLSQIRAHDAMDAMSRADPRRHFLGGWNGQHPFVSLFLGDLTATLADSESLLTAYSHLDEDEVLRQRLADLHADAYSERRPDPTCFVPGAGSSSFLTSLLHFARRKGHDEICYLPPVYYNAAYWIGELGFRVTRVAPRPVLSEVDQAELDLPPRRSLLWLTDPVWFAGRPLPVDVLQEVRSWQATTGSTVIVDGTFQYMGWDTAGLESSSGLDPEFTFRLVCPTKNLALHGFRFAYVIAPAAAGEEYRNFHSRMHGAASLSDRLFAHRAVSVLSGGEAAPLWGHVQKRFAALVDGGALDCYLAPRCGYFVFARPSADPGAYLGLSQDCFEASGLDGYTRVNLLDEDDIRFLLHVDRGATAEGTLG